MAQLATSFEEGSDIVAALQREDASVEVFGDASLLEQRLSLGRGRDIFAMGEGLPRPIPTQNALAILIGIMERVWLNDYREWRRFASRLMSDAGVCSRK